MNHKFFFNITSCFKSHKCLLKCMFSSFVFGNLACNHNTDHQQMHTVKHGDVLLIFKYYKSWFLIGWGGINAPMPTQETEFFWTLIIDLSDSTHKQLDHYIPKDQWPTQTDAPLEGSMLMRTVVVYNRVEILSILIEI